jgi:hypothetical protein
MQGRPLRHLLLAAACLVLGGSVAAGGRWAIAIILFAIGAYYMALFVNLVRILRRISEASPSHPPSEDT